jgi:hypothetical protein
MISINSNGELKISSCLTKYIDCTFGKLCKAFYAKVKQLSISMRDHIFATLKQVIVRNLLDVRYFPYFGSNQVWDGQSVIHCKDFIAFDTVNLYNPPSKKQKRLDGIRENLVDLVPSNEHKLWKLYIEKCLVPACSIWSQAYPNSNYPLPMTLSYFDQNHNDTIKGFIYFCIMHSHIQLRTKGKLDKKDKNFYPSFAIGTGKTQDCPLYFAKFVIFYLGMCKFTIHGLPEVSFPSHMTKTIKDNSHMTTDLFRHVSMRIGHDFAQFWTTAKAWEGTDRFYELLFNFSKELL